MKSKFGMRRQMLLVFGMVVVGELVSVADPITVFPESEGRIWQTVVDSSAPIEWPWEGGADAARLVIASHWDGAVTTATVARATGARRGAYDGVAAGTLGAPAGEERLYSLVLEQLAGETVVAAETARLAYVPGVAGGTITVRNARSANWSRTKSPSVLLAYDRAWTNETASAASAALDVSGAALDLAGTSGYEPFAPRQEGDALTLSFDGADAWHADLRLLALGMMLLFR